VKEHLKKTGMTMLCVLRHKKGFMPEYHVLHSEEFLVDDPEVS
jgi:hypothetical protein